MYASLYSIKYKNTRFFQAKFRHNYFKTKKHRWSGRGCTGLKNRKILKRERINSALESVFDYPLTIVEAPIGYGKTTAIRDFLADKGSPVLWISFLSEEDTVSFFWDMFAKEIGKLDEAMGTRLKSLGFPADAPQTATILSILDELEFGAGTTLVIDDFHLVRGPQIGALINLIAKERSENLHIVVVTRDTSNLDFAELLAKGLCNILPQRTLRFTDEEIHRYCVLMGIVPGADDMEMICEYTGGWISLVYLLLLGIKQGIPVGRNSAVDKLVEKVLFRACDGRVQQFLLKLSVMDSFTAQQAVFVTREARGDELLKKLRRENAFIEFDEATSVYKIHNVLLDFLRARHRDAAQRAELFRRVGEWYLAECAFVPAYEYLCRAGDTERILAILDDADNVTNNLAEFEGSLEMFAKTPRELLLKYPLAYLQYILTLLVSGNRGMAQDGTTRLDEMQAFYDESGDLLKGRKDHILAEICLVHIFASFNNVKKMLSYAHEALPLLKGDTSCLIQRHSEFTFGSPHLLYIYYRKPGSLRRIAEVTASCSPILPEISGGCATGCDYTAQAEYALETGDWQAAELNAFKAIYKGKTKEQTGIILCANLTLIRLYIFQGKTGEALELLRQLKADVAEENCAIYNTTLELAEGYVYGCLGRLHDIPQWLRSGDMSPVHFLYQGMAFNYIVYGRAVLLSGNDIQLEILTEEFPKYFSIFQNQIGFLHNQVLRSAALYRLYGMDKGCAVLKEALDMAREDHIILLFAEYAPAILHMMRSIAANEKGDAYLREVLSACKTYMKNRKQESQADASLTPREIEVLALAAEGLKRDEIAGRLNVSIGTVRTHLQNIYHKLEVGGRIAAVKKAEKMKLL